MKSHIEIRTKKCLFRPSDLERAAEITLRAIRKSGWGLNVAIVASPEMKAIHKKFFNDPSDTDSMSFSQVEGKLVRGEKILGDVFLCWDQIKGQAPRFGHTPKEELIYCMIHGILHLVGYDDATPRAKRKMFKKQDEIFRTLSSLRRQGSSVPFRGLDPCLRRDDKSPLCPSKKLKP